MGDNVIKFGKAKKQIAKAQKEAQAAENRVKFGRTKAEKQRDTESRTSQIKHVDDHERKDK